jgi:uncharacterized beta-barrel protein YwiB (DUF1934 family)
MNKDVLITLKSIQSVDSQSVETELITAGKYKKITGGYEIIYDESSVTGFEGSRTILSCYGNNRADMQRVGKAPSNLIIEMNKKHHCHYGTPYGEFMVGIFAHSIDNKLTDNGGDLYFKYTVDVNSSYISDNEVYINVKQD